MVCTLMPADRGDNSDSKSGTNPMPSIRSVENSVLVYGFSWLRTGSSDGL
jgi:hypothetical protein